MSSKKKVTVKAEPETNDVVDNEDQQPENDKEQSLPPVNFLIANIFKSIAIEESEVSKNLRF